MNYDEAQFEAALMRFARDPGDPVEIVQYLRWLWEKRRELDARMTAIESDLGDLRAEHTALAKRYVDLQVLYAARVAVDEAEEGY